jgi:AcrR family transcriptional regulator
VTARISPATGTAAGTIVRETTKERILGVALELFNARGEAGVTTAQIARELEISEGNLWYHFRTKRDLVHALFDRMERAIDDVLARPAGPAAPMAHFAEYTRRSVEVLWTYRFLFRDHAILLREDTERLARHAAFTDRGVTFVARILAGMVDAGLLRIERDHLHPVATNAWIIGRYWIDYLESKGVELHGSEAHVKGALAQMAVLLRPYMTPRALRQTGVLLDG